MEKGQVAKGKKQRVAWRVGGNLDRDMGKDSNGPRNGEDVEMKVE